MSNELRKVGTPRTFDFTPKDHVAIGKALDLIDFEAGAKVSGHGFYFLKNDAVLLDLALQQFAMRSWSQAGFTPIITPDLARVSILEGIGFTPRGAETQVYSVENSDLCLIGTAEITLGGMHADEILDEAALPLKYVGLSHCFRTEAGAAGRASTGLYRVHQFTKVEMFAFTATPETSARSTRTCWRSRRRSSRRWASRIASSTSAPATSGGPAYRKYDLEAWMPGRGEGGEYGEVTSTSDCTDYQARRLNIRYSPPGQKGTRFVHTLNGTAVALSRRADRRSWRTTSRPTAWSTSPRSCGLTWAKRSSGHSRGRISPSPFAGLSLRPIVVSSRPRGFSSSTGIAWPVRAGRRSAPRSQVDCVAGSLLCGKRRGPRCRGQPRRFGRLPPTGGPRRSR